MGTRHGFLSILITLLLTGLWPASAQAQEEPSEKEEKPASEKPDEPQSGSDEKPKKKSDEKSETEESEAEESEEEEPPAPPKKEFHPSGLPKPPASFTPKVVEEKAEEAPRYSSGLLKPPPLRGENAETAPKASPEVQPKPVETKPEPGEPLSIAERIRRLTERRLGTRPMAAPAEPRPRSDSPSLAGSPATAAELEELIPHVRVHILLRNGQTFEGIVKDQEVIKDLKAGRLALGPKARSSGKGFRLWYVYETEGYVRISNDQVREIKVLRTLTPQEVTGIHDRLAAQREATMSEEMERRRVRDARLALRQAEKLAGAAAQEVGETAEQVVENAEQIARYQQLLEQFPPKDGWTPERKDEIERRKITVDVFPSKTEQAFLESYDEWLPAYHWWVEQQEKEAAEGEGAGKVNGAEGADKPPIEKPVPADPAKDGTTPPKDGTTPPPPAEEPAPKKPGENGGN